jgi:hypothetical protein
MNAPDKEATLAMSALSPAPDTYKASADRPSGMLRDGVLAFADGTARAPSAEE